VEEQAPDLVDSDPFNQNLVNFRDTQKTKPSRKLQNETEVYILTRDILVYAEFLRIKEDGGHLKYLNQH